MLLHYHHHLLLLLIIVVVILHDRCGAVTPSSSAFVITMMTTCIVPKRLLRNAHLLSQSSFCLRYSSSRRSSSRRSTTTTISRQSIMMEPRIGGDSTTSNNHGAIRRSMIYMMPEGPEVRSLVDSLQGGIGRRLLQIEFLSGRYYDQHYNTNPSFQSQSLVQQPLQLQQSKLLPVGYEDFVSTLSPYPVAMATTSKGGDPTKQKDEKQVDVIQLWKCKGKFMYIVLDDGNPMYRRRQKVTLSKPLLQDNNTNHNYQRSIWITLGMTGRFVSESIHQGLSIQQQQNARWRMDLLDTTTNKISRIYYYDPRNFGTLKFGFHLQEIQKKLQSLGPDLLDIPTTTYQDFTNIISIQNPKLNICIFLMDQTKIAGIGNYILCEGLYRANIDPFASIQEINMKQQQHLFHELQAVAMESYQSQSTIMKYKQDDDDDKNSNNKSYHEFQLQCYGRQTCGQRGDPVLRETNGPHGRTIWYTERQLFMSQEQRMRQKLDGKNQPVNKEKIIDENNITIPFVPIVPKISTTIPTNTIQLDASFMSTITEPIGYALLQSLTDRNWKTILLDIFQSNIVQELMNFLQMEYDHGNTIYPPREEIFAALNLCPFHQVKVVIVGQDPYHGPGQGHGLAFSVRPGIVPPPSLKNIFREIQDDIIGDNETNESPMNPSTSMRNNSNMNGSLIYWTKQGVFLLNTVLTVRKGEANSHAGKGWEYITDEIIQQLNDQHDNLVFLLWGKPAHMKAKNVDPTRHVIIRTSHPSPLGATKTANPFLGSKCFSQTNTALRKAGKDPIDWILR